MSQEFVSFLGNITPTKLLHFLPGFVAIMAVLVDNIKGILSGDSK